MSASRRKQRAKPADLPIACQVAFYHAKDQGYDDPDIVVYRTGAESHRSVMLLSDLLPRLKEFHLHWGLQHVGHAAAWLAAQWNHGYSSVGISKEIAKVDSPLFTVHAYAESDDAPHLQVHFFNEGTSKLRTAASYEIVDDQEITLPEENPPTRNEVKELQRHIQRLEDQIEGLQRTHRAREANRVEKQYRPVRSPKRTGPSASGEGGTHP